MHVFPGDGRAMSAGLWLRLPVLAGAAFLAWVAQVAAEPNDPPPRTMYVSAEGDDAWDGQAASHQGGSVGPWRTLARVNQAMQILEGCDVLFRRGDRFAGQLRIRGRKIRFAAFGEGPNPVLTGAGELAEGWEPVVGRPNVYQQRLPAAVKDVTLVARGATLLPLGRTPNGDLFSTFASRSVDSITDPELSGADGLIGAEIVLRKDDWSYHSHPVTGVDGTVVRFAPTDTSESKLTAAGYFFQKHLGTLDAEGEWFFDEASRTLYLHSILPPDRSAITYSAEPTVVQISKSADITLESLTVEMAASHGIEVSVSSDLRVLDSEITRIGRDGLRLYLSTALIQGNRMSLCLGNGIFVHGHGRSVVIKRNVISEIGLIPGRGWDTGPGLPGTRRRNGINILGGGSEVSFNRLSEIGHIGVHHLGGRNLVRRNVIERYNRVTFDGGGIYTFRDQAGSVVEENFVLRGSANESGLSDARFFSTGIQCDANTANLIVRHNTIAYPRSTADAGCIHLNTNARGNVFVGNTILTDFTGISTLDRDPVGRELPDAATISMSGNRFEENVIVRRTVAGIAGGPHWAAFLLQDSSGCDLDRQGVFCGNACAVPFGGGVIREAQRRCRDPRKAKFDTWFATAADWNRSRPYAQGNLDAPLRLPADAPPDGLVRLLANDSDEPKTFTLEEGVEYLDPHGKPHAGRVTVAPWRSLIILRIPAGDRPAL